MKFSSQGTILFPLSIWEQRPFYQNDHNIQMYYGLYFGIFIVMILYNLFLYISIRDTAYIYYVIYLVGGFYSMMSINGFVLEYLFPNSPIFVNSSMLFGIGFALI